MYPIQKAEGIDSIISITHSFLLYYCVILHKAVRLSNRIQLLVLFGILAKFASGTLVLIGCPVSHWPWLRLPDFHLPQVGCLFAILVCLLVEGCPETG